MRDFGVASMVVALIAVVSSCGAHQPRIGDGRWFGRIVAVDVDRSTVTFMPACVSGGRGRWTAAPDQARVVVRVARNADLMTSYRRSATSAASAPADLEQVARAVSQSGSSTRPRGWWVTVRKGAAVRLQEDLGVRLLPARGLKAFERKFACISSPETTALLDR